VRAKNSLKSSFTGSKLRFSDRFSLPITLPRYVLKEALRLAGAALLLLLGSCTHAPPQVTQVFDQVNRVYDPAEGAWTERLSVFVQASSSDGVKVFDRLHLIHDGHGLFVTLNRSQWASSTPPGEFWMGVNNLEFSGGVPTGEWRALLVTRSGQKVESKFVVPPPARAASPRTIIPVVRPDLVPQRYQVSGWVDSYLVWARDARGAVLSRAKTFGPTFEVPTGTVSFELYSYDNDRGEGLVAGPFPVQNHP